MRTASITAILTVPVRSGFFVDDQAAIRAGAVHDGFGYRGAPSTKGFESIRQPGEALSVLLILDDGFVAEGDCAAAQYGGVGGRDALFSSSDAAVLIVERVAPRFEGAVVSTFRELARELGSIPSLGSAIRYGVSQALLAAVAHVAGVTMAEIVRDEYETGVDLLPVPLYAQTGDERYLNADKMILRGVPVLPHGLINSADSLVGPDGELLIGYLRWLVERITTLRPRADYRPRLHIDTYGTIGEICGLDVARVAECLIRLGDAAAPYELTVEHPVDAGSVEAQIAFYAELRAMLSAHQSTVQLAVDEWCNSLDDIRRFVAAGAADVIHVKTPDLGSLADTIEALLLVRRAGLRSFCGGSSNETDLSARVSAHVAMACGASQILAKPGMGVDEGLMIVGNEMARTAALARRRTEEFV